MGLEGKNLPALVNIMIYSPRQIAMGGKEM